MNWYIVYEVRSTEWTIQFIFDETEKDICFIRWRITETKIANQNYQIIKKQINIFIPVSCCKRL